MASLATTVAGISFPSCVYNASGPRTGSSAAMCKITASAAGGVLAKSATVESQTGNPQPRTWQSDAASLNSEGLPNSGIDYYISPQTITETMGANADGKPYMVSISGKNLADNLTMLQKIAEARKADGRIAGVELNLACPNVIGKPIIAYDFDQMDSVLKAVEKLGLYRDIPLGVKMVRYYHYLHVCVEVVFACFNMFRMYTNRIFSKLFILFFVVYFCRLSASLPILMAHTSRRRPKSSTNTREW